ncbi:hypothetical protein P9Z80_12635 [Bacillus cereus]|nr:hypothetical protein [Bacillus cereus]MEC3257851.1 hypothetical protein [Bacillus cereus]
MRHVRLKQLVTYKYGRSKKAKQIYQKKKSDAIYFGKRSGSISTMELGKMFHTSWGILDPTFEWDRRMNRVQWSFWNGNIVTTKFALLKNLTVPRWFVKLKRKEIKR